MTPRRRAVGALALVFAACHPGGESATGAGILVSHAYVLEPLAAEGTAAYFTVANTGAAATLVGISADFAGRASLHEQVVVGGGVTMRPLGPLEIAPGARITFAPGGRHAMLMDLTRTPGAGDSVGLTFHFRRAGDVSVRAIVISFAELDAYESEAR